MKQSIKLALNKRLDELGITRYQFSKKIDVDFQTVDKYYKNKVVRYDSHLLLKFCVALDCEIGDIVEISK